MMRDVSTHTEECRRESGGCSIDTPLTVCENMMCVLACPSTGAVSSSFNGTSLIPMMIDWLVNLFWITAPAYRVKRRDLHKHMHLHWCGAYSMARPQE
jgi:hypothetical protein